MSEQRNPDALSSVSGSSSLYASRESLSGAPRPRPPRARLRNPFRTLLDSDPPAPSCPPLTERRQHAPACAWVSLIAHRGLRAQGGCGRRRTGPFSTSSPTRSCRRASCAPARAAPRRAAPSRAACTRAARAERARLPAQNLSPPSAAPSWGSVSGQRPPLHSGGSAASPVTQHPGFMPPGFVPPPGFRPSTSPLSSIPTLSVCPATPPKAGGPRAPRAARIAPHRPLPPSLPSRYAPPPIPVQLGPGRDMSN
jgi:hypothetical protein